MWSLFRLGTKPLGWAANGDTSPTRPGGISSLRVRRSCAPHATVLGRGYRHDLVAWELVLESHGATLGAFRRRNDPK